jgi:hypothetical protein
MLCCRAVKTAQLQEAAALGGARSQQLGAEKLVGDLVGVQQPLALAHLFPAGAGAAVLVAEFVADPRGQLLHGLVKGRVVLLLHERDDVPVLAAAKAVVAAHLWPHRK